ncbi:transporter substrate-binding domain-containing protein [Pseudochelatococcus sp. B33]
MTGEGTKGFVRVVRRAFGRVAAAVVPLPQGRDRQGRALVSGGIFYLLAVGLIAVGLVLGLAQGPVAAQPVQEGTARTVTVGLYISPPFVTASDGVYSGMAIDLWQAIATRLDMASRYEVYPTFRALIDATRGGNIDIAVTNLTITRDRAEVVAFTQPWYDAGLRIMVPDDGTGGFWNVVNALGNAGHLQAYALLLLAIAAGTVALTLLDRHFDPSFPRRWRDGLAESLHHVVSIVRSGNTTHKNLFGWKGRVFSVIWMVCGVAVIAYITSSVTSVMTALSLERQINSLADLPGRTVGVFTGSVAEGYVTELGIASRSYAGIEEAAAAIRDGWIDAVVGDAPILEYHAHTHPEQKLAVVGKIFHPDKYGFAFPHDSDLVRPVTLQILDLHEDGTVGKLRSTYFGSAH